MKRTRCVHEGCYAHEAHFVHEAKHKSFESLMFDLDKKIIAIL